MENVRIVGTSHIAKQSLREVTKAILEWKPDIVAIEIDRKRFPGLFAKKQQSIRVSDILKVGVRGFLFAMLGSWAERKLGESVGMKPGSEMRLAVQIARKQKAKIALIDQDIDITLKRLSESITWKEKWNFIVELCKGFLGKKPEFVFDLRTVPEGEIIKRMIGRLKESYPNIYHVLITERNEVMGKRIRQMHKEHPDKKILCIVGAGHKEGIEEMLSSSPEISVAYNLPKGMKLIIG